MQLDGVITIHNIVKQRAPESDPVTEGGIKLGLLQGIVDKPDLVLFGHEPKYKTSLEKAACLLEGLASLHPFTDGNKRTALLLHILFYNLKATT